ncbi:MAG TPA: peptidoglycan-binding protein [Candidatus Limiplasma sp.]|nr:peptidoglycan-binding protein [Candidatus Limiplasma sp.]
MKYHIPSKFLTIVLLSLCIIVLPLFSALATDIGYINVKVVLREESSKTSKALQTLPEGEKVTVLRTSGEWYRVRYGNFTGYIMQQYVDMSDSSVIANQDKIDDLGDAPGALNIGDEGNDVKKLQKALAILGYYTMKADGIYGNGTTTAVALFQQANDLYEDGIAGKHTITAIFGSCARTSDITVSGSDAVGSEDDDQYESVASSTSTKNVVSSYAEIGSVPDACSEGDSGSDVIKVQQALYLLGYYNSVIDGDYGTQTVEAVKHFQKNRGMKQDGIAGTSTIRVLFSGMTTEASSSSSSSSSTTYETLVLDWFEDNVSAVIPKHATFTIKDVRTGKTFKAKRWSGVNHLDAEPLTAEDTATMKSIYGGSWSWSRRPILILYKNKVYAASMNGMPHGTTTISGNNFDGHFCIHFKNSKTHETEKVDSAHQACVTEASKATW